LNFKGRSPKIEIENRHKTYATENQPKRTTPTLPHKTKKLLPFVCPTSYAFSPARVFGYFV